jgi:hypothetical protein
MAGKKVASSRSSKKSVEPSSTRVLSGTAAILDRYSRIGALYVRRTETVALTLLLEVGVRPTDRPEEVRWLSTLQAEQELARVGGPRPPRPTNVNLVNTPAPVATANRFAPLSPGESWADVVADETPLPVASATPAIPRANRPTPAAPRAPVGASQPKAVKATGKGQEVPKEPNMEKRSLDRFGCTLAKLRSTTKVEDVEGVQNVLNMTQTEYRFFRAQQREASEAEAPPGGPSQAAVTPRVPAAKPASNAGKSSAGAPGVGTATTAAHAAAATAVRTAPSAVQTPAAESPSEAPSASVGTSRRQSGGSSRSSGSARSSRDEGRGQPSPKK